MKTHDITDNKEFWKYIQPCFSDKGYSQTKMTIVEKNSIIRDEKKIATLMNNYVKNIPKNLYLKPFTVPNTSDIDKITKHFDDHISVCKIKEAYSEILREDNFRQSQERSFEIKLKKIFHLWCHPCKYPKTNHRGSFEISDKHYQ